MASTGDLEAWKSLGGTVKEQKNRKQFVAPSGTTPLFESSPGQPRKLP